MATMAFHRHLLGIFSARHSESAINLGIDVDAIANTTVDPLLNKLEGHSKGNVS